MQVTLVGALSASSTTRIFQDASHVGRRLVRLVHHQNVSRFSRRDERAVVIYDNSLPHSGLKRQCLHSRVSVQLNVFSWLVQQVEKSIHNLVLPGALVANEQKMLAQQEVLKHCFHNRKILRCVVEQSFRHLASSCWLEHRCRGVANSKSAFFNLADSL